MGSKKGGKSSKVDAYFMALHYGVCGGPINYVWDIRISEKDLSTYMSPPAPWVQSGTYAITPNDVFGGETGEGGTHGTINMMFGESNQVAPAALASVLGLTSDTCPGFRGVCTFFMNNGSGGGWYWGLNNPFLRPVEIEIECIPLTWFPALARIPRTPPLLPYDGYIQNPGGGGAILTANSINKLDSSSGYNVRGETNNLLDVWSIPGNVYSQIGIPYAFGNFEGLHIYGSYLITREFDVGEILVGILHYNVNVYDFTGALIHDIAMPLDSLIIPFSTMICSNADGVIFGSTSDGLGHQQFWTIQPDFTTLHHADAADALTPHSNVAMGLSYVYIAYAARTVRRIDISSFAIVDIVLGTLTSDIANVCYVDFSGEVVIVCVDGVMHRYSADLSTHLASNNTGIGTVVSGFNSSKRMVKDGVVVIMTQRTGISDHNWDAHLISTDILEVVLTYSSDQVWTDGTTSHSWAVDQTNNFSNAVYNPDQNGVWMVNHLFEWVYWPFPAPTRAEMNPSHIIYHALTNTEWGMSAPTYALDTASFSSAASTLYIEQLGLSLKWDKQTSIEAFVNDILSHINGTLFLKPSTGLITLKLIRNDYVFGDLPIFNEDNCMLTSFARKSWGDTTNEILVQWTNPESEQEETIPAHDNANISIQGGIVSDTRDYYGIRRVDIAKNVALRDLTASSWPTAMLELEADRDAWDLAPGEVFRFDWAEYGLSALVFRITSIDYGKPGAAQVKVTAVEDVFSLTLQQYVAPAGATRWESPAVDPTALAFEQPFTLTYYQTIRLVSTFIDANYPDVGVGMLGGQTGTDTNFLELFGPEPAPTGTTPYADLKSLRICRHATTIGSLAAETSTVLTSSQHSDFTQGQTIAVNNFVILGTTDTAQELCVITAYDSTTGDITLQRGCLDTIPVAWPTSTPLWILSSDTDIDDPQVRSALETISYKCCAITSNGIYPVASASPVSITTTERPYLPLRPANVAVGGVHFSGTYDAEDGANFSVTWANRNRVTEDSVVLAWTDSTVAIETGQTTTIHVYDQDGTTLLGSITGLTGTSHTINPTTDLFTSEQFYVFLKVVSVRAGYESLMGMTFKVLLPVTDDDWAGWVAAAG